MKKNLVGVGAVCVGAVLISFLASAAGAAEPCCSVKSINMRTKTVVVTEKATGCTLEFGMNDPEALKKVKVGALLDLDVKKLVVSSDSTTSSTGQAASSTGGTTSCGSNVGRYAQTKTCYVQGKDGKWQSIPCTK